MIVLDASALLELILRTPLGDRVVEHIADPSIGLHAPHLVDVEVAQVLRRYERNGTIDTTSGQEALIALRDLDLQRHAHEPLLERIWALRHGITAYDAAYVALAELLDGELLTSDGRLARAPGLRCRVRLLTA